MGDDVVEGAEARIDIQDRDGPQLDVLEAEIGDLALACRDLARREIDAEKAAPGMVDCHGDEIAARGPAQLQDAATLQSRRRQAEEPPHRMQMADMAPGKGIAFVRHQIIGIGCLSKRAGR